MTSLIGVDLTPFAFLEEQQLWQRIKNFEIDNPKAKEPFSQRLAKDKNWELDFTKRVIDEYLKFCFLAVSIGKCTPSLTVDQAWHLHLIYSKNYWKEFCPNVLEYDLHHCPGTGEDNEKKIFEERYTNTLGYYRQYFGGDPPVDIW
ncbi:MAG: hypothetical protein PHC51_03810 [bacterium]|nr:hypothetical protein [bacterium]